MEESEFKKLTANSRDWEIYKLLSQGSKETVIKEIELGKKISEKAEESLKGETTVQETVRGKVSIVTDKAVLIQVGDRVAWFPKSVIENLDKIVLKTDTQVELDIKDWFKYKIEWKVPTQ